MTHDDDLERRLRDLAGAPVPDAVAQRHLGAMASTSPRSRRPIAAVAAAALLFGVGGAAWAAGRSGDDPSVTSRTLVADSPNQLPAPAGPEPAQDEPDDLIEDDQDVPPDDEAAPENEAAPEDDPTPEVDGSEMPGRAQRYRPHADDPCKGPPPFAGTPAVPGETPSRSEQARAHAEMRAACHGDAPGPDEPTTDDPTTDE